MIVDYINIPFVNKSSSKNGCDCFGLVRYFYREELCIDIPDPRISCNQTHHIFSEYQQQIQKNWITIQSPENFCVVAMAHDLQIPKQVQHFGIYLEGGKILHTLKNVNSHIVSIENYRWAIKGFHKWKY